MSEQLITPHAKDDAASSADVESWHRVASEYKNWHPGLHPYVETQLAARGILQTTPETRHNTVPDVEYLLRDIIAETNDPAIRKALRAEHRHESSPELEAILDTIIGTKLHALETNDQELFEGAEQIVIEARKGNGQANHEATQGLKRAESHRQHLLDKRQKELLDLGYTADQIEQWGTSSEELGYEHLSLVHATDYLPRRHESDGLLHIGTSFEATGLPRNTVHVALNHMVESNVSSSDWSDKHFLIVAPMDGAVTLNGDPSAMIAHDTWWEADPYKGLTLPPEAIIIRPGSTKPVEAFPSLGEVRYKSHGITVSDIDNLLGASHGYEVALAAQKLGIIVERTVNSHSRLHLSSLEQHITELDPTERSKVAEALKSLLVNDPTKAESIFADTAKRLAVRQALALQGREVIEPMTHMQGEFMSEELSNELRSLRHGKTVQGHHSNTGLYYLEKTASELMLNPEQVSDESLDRLRQQIKDNADELALSTLRMYYRLGLF